MVFLRNNFATILHPGQSPAHPRTDSGYRCRLLQGRPLLLYCGHAMCYLAVWDYAQRHGVGQMGRGEGELGADIPHLLSRPTYIDINFHLCGDI